MVRGFLHGLAALLVPALALSACSEAPMPAVPTAVGTPSGVEDLACPRETVVAPRIRLGLPRQSVGRGDACNLLTEALSRRTGLPVDTVLVDRYEDLPDGLAKGFLEAAIIPPLEYVRAHDRDPCLRSRLTMVFDGAVRYSAFIVARQDSGLTDLRQLAGRSVAFVDQNSASGWLFPVARLAQMGINPFLDLSETQFLGSHRRVIEAVLDGRVDAGATYLGGIQAARAEGLDVSSLTLLGITGRIPYDAFVVRPDLDPSQARQLVEALQSIRSNTPEGRAALAAFPSGNGFTATSDSFYEPVREVLKLVRRLGGEVP